METLKEVVAKILSCTDNDSFMHRDETTESSNVCNRCNIPLDREVNSSFKLSKRQYDVSATYDGYVIVSNRFKDFCESKEFVGINFKPLEQEREFSVLMDTNQTVDLNHIRRKKKLEEYCPECSRFSSVAGASPNFLKILI